MFERAKYKDKDSSWEMLENPVGSRKYDGAHFFLKFDSEGNPSFISRRQSVKGHYPDRTDKLPHLIKALPEFKDTVHSVELIHTGFNPSKDAPDSHSEVSGILNSLTAKALETQALTGPIRAVLLDTIHPRLPTFDAKIRYLKELEQAFDKPGLVYTPDYIEGLANIRSLISSTKVRKHEGVIILSKSLPEESNPRYKVKHVNTYNLRVVGVTQELDKSGTPKPSAGALVVQDGAGREVGNVGTGLSHALRKDIWGNKQNWINQLIQVKAMDPTANRLRSPVFNGIADGTIDTL